MCMHSSLFSFIFLTKKKRNYLWPWHFHLLFSPSLSLSCLRNDVVICIYTSSDFPLAYPLKKTLDEISYAVLFSLLWIVSTCLWSKLIYYLNVSSVFWMFVWCDNIISRRLTSKLMMRHEKIWEKTDCVMWFIDLTFLFYARLTVLLVSIYTYINIYILRERERWVCV